MRRAVPVLAILLLAPAAVVPASDGAVEDLVLTVDGQPAHGLVTRTDGAPTANVLVLHGYGHQAESHRGHLEALALRGAAAVAMDYRGPVSGFPLANGAADSCAAFAPLVEAHPDAPRILYSVSMGTAVASLVLEQCPVFDWWVNNEGLAMLHETWAGATALYASGNPTAVNAKDGLEAECGGTPATAPDCYLARSAALKAAQYTRLKGVYLTHGLNDGLVPYDQGREMVAALRAQGIPSDFYTVVRGNPGGEGTSVTGYAGVQVDGLAGHGTESEDTHALTALSFSLLYRLVEGALAPPANAEFVVDREVDDAGLGTLP